MLSRHGRESKLWLHHTMEHGGSWESKPISATMPIPLSVKGRTKPTKPKVCQLRGPSDTETEITCMKKDSFVSKQVKTKTVKEMYCRAVLLPFQIISVECILWALVTFLHYWWIKLSLFKGSHLVTHEFLQMLLKKPSCDTKNATINIAIGLQKNELLPSLISYWTGESQTIQDR